jgi:hypothetical protein
VKNFIFGASAAYARSLTKTMPLLPGYRPLCGFIEFCLAALPLREILPRPTASARILTLPDKRD